MSLSCSCDDFDYEFDAGEWCYTYNYDLDFTPLDTNRRKRCCSCNCLIDIGALCIKYSRSRYPYSDVEARITTGCGLEDSFSDDAPIAIADHYHCERCGEIWLNLTDIGYECLSPSENMEDALKEYWDLSGFKANQSMEQTANSAAAHA